MILPVRDISVQIIAKIENLSNARARKRYKKSTHSLCQISHKILKEENETKQVMITEHVVK